MTIEEAEALIESSRPRSRLLRGSSIALLGLSMLLGAMLADPGLVPSLGIGTGDDGGILIVPQLVLIALISVFVFSARRQRKMSQWMQQGFEAVQLQEWPKAANALRRLLRHPVPQPAARTESLLALAAVAESEHQYEISQRIYEAVLDERKGDPLQMHTARVSLAAAMLRNGQLTDAVSLTGKLENEELPKALKAHVDLLATFRELTMGHHASDLNTIEDRRRLFREHLGTQAGYGYALLAGICDRASDEARARDLWHDATLLVPERDILHRFQELSGVAERYPSAEMKLPGSKEKGQPTEGWITPEPA
jgi:hypothetical protein